ncbi:MAG: YihY/virulence factor BrkB family protein [candidate division FCPU426 bacterium]
MKIRSILRLVKHAAGEWNAHAVPRFSAALAYYTFFSLAPLLTITIAICGIFFGRDAAEGRIHREIGAFVGPDTANAIEAVVRGAWKPGKDLWAIGLGSLTLLLGAVGVLNELKGALDFIWGVKRPSSARIIFLDQTKLLGFLLGIGFLLVVSLVGSAFVAALGAAYGSWLPLPEAALHFLDLIFEWAVIIFIFAAIFKWLPDAEIAWKDVWIGAAFTSFLFLSGKFLLSFYIGKSGISSVYGAAGSLIVILVWVYYSALIFYFGAEFTKVYANTYGSHVKGR